MFQSVLDYSFQTPCGQVLEKHFCVLDWLMLMRERHISSYWINSVVTKIFCTEWWVNTNKIPLTPFLPLKRWDHFTCNLTLWVCDSIFVCPWISVLLQSSCVSLHVEIQHTAFLKIPAYWPIHFSHAWLLSGIYHGEGGDRYKHTLPWAGA